MRYLGVPLFSGALTHAMCLPLIDKVRRKVQSWTGFLLSKSGRVELIKSVLLSYSHYWTSGFALPKRTVKDLEKLMRSFLWSGEGGIQKQHQVAWQTICSPVLEGGLGLKRILDWNEAAIGTRFWELASFKPSQWSLWMQKRYLSKGSIWTIQPSCSCSWSWRRIIKAREWIKKDVIYIIFNGLTINLWDDPWLHGSGLKHHFNGAISFLWGPPRTTSVHSLISNCNWAKPSRWPASFDYVWDLITDLEVGGCGPDILVWKGHKSGQVSTSAAWNVFRHQSPTCDWSQYLWHPIQVQKHSFLCWQALLNKLPTRARLQSRGLSTSGTCGLCNIERESVEHLFIHCSFSAYVWTALLNSLGLRRKRFPTLADHVSWLVSLAKSPSERSVLLFLLTQTFWTIWIERNSRIFNDKQCSKVLVVRRIIQATTSRFQKTVMENSDSPLASRITLIFGINFKDKPVTSTPVIWAPPPNGWFKANSDGSRSEDRFGFGALLCIADGGCVQAISARVRDCSINLLELKGIVAGIQIALSIGAQQVWSETDSTAAIAWAKGRGTIPWTALRDIRSLHNITASFKEWRISHIYREGNRVADLLAAHQPIMGIFTFSPPNLWEALEKLIQEDWEGIVQIRTG
ncbi:hypothetical protein QJS10_CPA03g01261 [Acorus calamus]|uniref:Uncharacterized protein n=1 Tax=Acorus calamus TaxID=4465 RepID=A0AAV9F7P1_ACOCL|nr:hypothetical protein QJS10_CPA03g01261 [Acorus calamus]